MTTMTTGNQGAANYEITIDESNAVIVKVWRDYPPSGALPTTAQQVWQIVANFGAVKTIFPTVLSTYLTYPDATTTEIKTVRYMTFAPPDSKSPLSATNPLPFAVEQLTNLDEQARQLTYISVLGLGVGNYQSVMEVTGEDACRLTWTSTFTIDSASSSLPETIAHILSGGANQIATALGLE